MTALYRGVASVVSASRTSDGDAQQTWSHKGPPRPLPPTIHFVPLPRLVFPTSALLSWPGRNCRPGTTRSTSIADNSLKNEAVDFSFGKHSTSIPVFELRFGM